MEKSPIKLAILGGTGFIGKALERRAKQEQGVRVSIFNSRSLNLLSDDAPEKLARILDPATIVVVLARSCTDKNDPTVLVENVKIATNVARSFELVRVKKCVYFSSTSVYEDDQTNLEITEEQRFFPSSLYGISKFAAERLLERETSRHGVPLLTVRPCMIYGPEDKTLAYGPMRFLRDALDNKPIQLFGDGKEERDYLFIEDLANITLELMTGKSVGIFNLASDKPHSFARLANLINSITSNSSGISNRDRTQPKASRTVSIAKLRRTLPAIHFTPLEVSLCRTIKAVSFPEKVSVGERT